MKPFPFLLTLIPISSLVHHSVHLLQIFGAILQLLYLFIDPLNGQDILHMHCLETLGLVLQRPRIQVLFDLFLYFNLLLNQFNKPLLQ